MEFSLSWDSTQGPGSWTPARVSPSEPFSQGLAGGPVSASLRPSGISFPSLCAHLEKRRTSQLSACLWARLALQLSVELPGSKMVTENTEAQSPQLSSGGQAMLLGPGPSPLSLQPPRPHVPTALQAMTKLSHCACCQASVEWKEEGAYLVPLALAGSQARKAAIFTP